MSHVPTIPHALTDAALRATSLVCRSRRRRAGALPLGVQDTHSDKSPERQHNHTAKHTAAFRTLQTFATKLGDDEEILDTIRLSLVAFCSVFKLQVCALREVSLITRTRMLELTAAPCTVCTARLVQRACRKLGRVG